MFAQYGVDEKSAFPYADLFLVDVPSNQFVPRGVKHGIYKKVAEPGFTGEGAMFTLLEENLLLKKQLRIIQDK